MDISMTLFGLVLWILFFSALWKIVKWAYTSIRDAEPHTKDTLKIIFFAALALIIFFSCAVNTMQG